MTMWKPHACQIDRHMIANSAVFGLPSQSGPWMPNLGEDGVDQPVGLVHEQPQHGDDDDRGDHGQEVDGPEEVDATHLHVDQHRQPQRDRRLDRHDDDGEDDGVAQRLPEDLVVEQPDEVVDPDERGRPRRDQPGVGEGEDEGEDDRDDQESDQQHGRWDEHQPGNGGGAFPNGLVAMGRCDGGRCGRHRI